VKKIPPAPPGWNKTLADLMSEVDSGLRQSVSSPEIDWAHDYERSLLPSDTRFPCEGEVYEALDDILVDYLTSWATPFTGGGKGTLLRGEKVVIRYAPKDTRPILVYADPVDYAAVERRVVPAVESQARGYERFHLAISTRAIIANFRPIED
jgi:hypothetical protein